MIGLEDCIAMCGLEPEEVAAICEHEQICEVQAAALKSLIDRFVEQLDQVFMLRVFHVDTIC